MEKKLRAPVINATLYNMLKQIEPSRDGDIAYYPCQVILNNGDTHDRVYVVEERTYIKHWGVYPEDDKGKRGISISQVDDIKESPYRLPVKLANKIYKAGESGMGYCVFTLVMKNGDHITFVTGNAVDFVDLDPKYSYRDIAGILPNKGIEKLQDKNHQWLNAPYTSGADYIWCLFNPPKGKGPV